MYCTRGRDFLGDKPMTESTSQHSPNDHMYSTTGGHFPCDKTLDITHSAAREEIRSLRSISPYNH